MDWISLTSLTSRSPDGDNKCDNICAGGASADIILILLQGKAFTSLYGIVDNQHRQLGTVSKFFLLQLFQFLKFNFYASSATF